MPTTKNRLPELLKKHQADLLEDWVRAQLAALSQRGIIKEAELREQSRRFLELMTAAAQSGSDIQAAEWRPVREFLGEISRVRGAMGFSPSETATFIFSFKEPWFARLRREYASDTAALADEYWSATLLLDKLGLYTTEIYQKSREDIIRRQQQDMLELSTPVVMLWPGILALPLIGTLDSARTQVVMESLLNRIVETESEIAIIDITGVPTVDTLVAQHLLKAVAAARLMGADCFISGIRPQIAQTMVHLAVDMKDVTTKATLSNAFAMALERLGQALPRTTRASTGNGANTAGAVR